MGSIGFLIIHPDNNDIRNNNIRRFKVQAHSSNIGNSYNSLYLDNNYHHHHQPFPKSQARSQRNKCVLLEATSNSSGEELFLSEENAVSVIEDCMTELGTIFGNTQENQKVGITGLIEFVELDGPNMVIRFSGRFWHDKKMVLARVTNYIKTRIPECLDIILENPEQLEEDDQDSVKEFYRG